ncbi:helix-turn-helix transcriptional regulator [Paenibacillus sp. NFR01]|uniref:helix-turn-helix domain-containing protein n=1 Tax=Paenibacillus sp. NFR01 TaxID=1566279 RepID=UPI0008CA2440|nr:helix-turn-helix transcriptional regulator [Paenibacillus sp. NFR01]SEU23769.1 hypothetical protein SAMN03159358_4237 [Paenibacillus sp. NFR01]
MEPTPTILAELDHYMKKEALTVARFAERSGLHSGTLSNILHGHRPIAMQQLDRITMAMQLPEGFFYELYIDNYIIDSQPDWRRISPLLQRCAELGMLEAIRRVIMHLMDNLAYSPLLFNTAEELLEQGYPDAAALLFESVAEGERFQHSERLAFCRFRLFAISLRSGQETTLRAANQFEPYVERLDETDQLDALKQLADVFASLHYWDKVDELAERLKYKASIQYRHSLKRPLQKQPSRLYIYYILYSFLLRSAAAEERGDFETALQYAAMYSNVNWMKSPPSPEEEKVIEQFKEWSTANTYLYRLMSGDVAALPDYIRYIENKENEIFPALYKIIQAANRYRFSVDELLLRFSHYLPYRSQRSRLGEFSEQITSDRYLRFLAELAVYYLERQQPDPGFHYLLESLERSVKIKKDSTIVRCVGIFEQYRYLAAPESSSRYTRLIIEAQNGGKLDDPFVGTDGKMAPPQSIQHL